MKISTRLKLTGVFSLAVVAVMGAMLLSATQQVRGELTKNEVAGEVFNAVSSLRYLTQEYALSHEERTQIQWNVRHASLLQLLASATHFASMEEQGVIDELRRNH